MRSIHVDTITAAVKKLCIEVNYVAGEDIVSAIKEGAETEASPIGRNILNQILENASLAKEKQMPICQDTGMAIVFLTVGQDVNFEGGSVTDAINEGVRQGYEEGFLRKSVVSDPLIRINTGDNTPAVIHYELVSGDQVKIEVSPKGFGSENMSQIHMLKPADGVDGVKEAIIRTVDEAGGNACPPIIVGVGIGGSFEKSAILAKRALLRNLNEHSELDHIREIEEDVLTKVNQLGIGPQGLGGNTTALAIHIETYPTHIAGLPVAVNISCHVTRHGKVTL